jgi:hypothetical protein
MIAIAASNTRMPRRIFLFVRKGAGVEVCCFSDLSSREGAVLRTGEVEIPCSNFPLLSTLAMKR